MAGFSFPVPTGRGSSPPCRASSSSTARTSPSPASTRPTPLIGATAHYATEDLDEGPIIEQDVVRVTHHDSAEELERRGADVERTVLARAVQWHCEDRVVRDGERTVVF